MTRLLIHQPEFFPWINLFLRIGNCDIFIFLDSVQYSRRSFQNRNKIKTKDGEKWLTVPIKKSSRETLIKNIEISYENNWQLSHLNLIHNSYKNAENFRIVMPFIEKLYSKKHKNLNDLNQSIIQAVSLKIGYKKFFKSSSSYKIKSKKSDLILDICKINNCKTYITGIGSKNYLDENKFIKNNIKIKYYSPKKIVYKQQNKNLNFVPDLSIMDYLFNVGFKKII